MPHATSKRKNSSDIYSLHTLGFRGEALPSIASVSKLNIKSKIQDDEFGMELYIEGGKILSKEECATQKAHANTLFHPAAPFSKKY